LKLLKREKSSKIIKPKFILLLILKLSISGVFTFLFVIFIPVLFRPMDIWELSGMSAFLGMSIFEFFDFIYTLIYFFASNKPERKPLFWQDD